MLGGIKNTMIVDGKKIAEDMLRELQAQVSQLEKKPHLTVFTCKPNFETQKFLSLKKSKAEEVGVDMNVIEFLSDVTTEEVVRSLKNSLGTTNGIIVQLPFPSSVDVQAIFKTLPASHDVDVLGEESQTSNMSILSPVISSIRTLIEMYDIDVSDKKVVVVGEGKLVGKPAQDWFIKNNAEVITINRGTEDIENIIKGADILVLGAGVPGLITSEMIQKGVIIFDAGTSEEGGRLAGDAAPDCADRSSIFTPVPGGIGPMTIAALLQNVVFLHSINETYR